MNLTWGQNGHQPCFLATVVNSCALMRKVLHRCEQWDTSVKAGHSNFVLKSRHVECFYFSCDDFVLVQYRKFYL